MKHTPGPWTVEPFLTPGYDDDPLGVYKVQPVFDELTELYEKMDPEEDEDFDAKVHDVNAGNAHLISQAPAMYEKLVDTVAWLDREIKEGKKHSYCVSVNDINRLEELRDDLAETLRKIEGVQA